MRVAATAPVVAVGAEVAESFLSSALLWLARLEQGPRAARAQELWLIAPTKLAAALAERLALLREDLRAVASVFELKDEQPNSTDDERRDPTNDERNGFTNDEHGGLTQVRVPGLEELLDAPAPRLLRSAEQ